VDRQSHRGGIRKARIVSHEAFQAALVYYPPGLSQPEHDHSCAQLSLLLSGSLVESVAGRTVEAGPGQLSMKPKGVVHSDTYGPNGAMFLAFNFRCEETARAALADNDWQWRRANLDAPTWRLRLAAEGVQGDECLWDVLAAAETPLRSQPAPNWLRWAKSRLDLAEPAPDIGSLAADAGVHRVHFSRQFARFFGLTPSAYRSRQMAGRALRAMIDDHAVPAMAAADAGFADQSHMARAIRAAFGTTPRRLATLFAD
jgi:AraC family transcriptional regulator